jgi:TIR domain
MAPRASGQVPYGPPLQPVIKAVGAPASQTTEAGAISILYTHDNQAHKAWVKALADRLSRDGFHVGLDQYDLGPGDEMSTFMEQLVTGAHFKIVVCSNAYVEKTNALRGGAGYEKTLLARSLVKSQARSDIIPVIRNNSLEEPLPNFLGTRLYVDFRDDVEFEFRYVELSRKLRGLPPSDRPLPATRLNVGDGTFGIATIAHGPTRAVPSSGTVVFNYSSNDGVHTVEAGEDCFEPGGAPGARGPSMHTSTEIISPLSLWPRML